MYIDSVIDLSSYKLNKSELSLLSKGLNFSTKKSYNCIEGKVQAENLYNDILNKASNKQLTVDNKAELEIKLKNFSLRAKKPDTTKDNLSKEEHVALKKLKSNNEIVVQRPDKGAGVVILDKKDYDNKLLELISDPSKFATCDSKRTETVKKKINNIAEKYNSKYKLEAAAQEDNLSKFQNTNYQIYKKLKRTGEYCPGHLYGLPKVHKNAENPPLRPMI